MSSSLHTEPAVDALEMAIWSRRWSDLAGFVHHSDRVVQAKGDSYDNALVESVNGLYKTELIQARGLWRTVDQVELATAAWVAWWNERRLHSVCGDVPPAEYEAAYHSRLQAAALAAWNPISRVSTTQGGSSPSPGGEAAR